MSILALNLVDRQALSISAPLILKEFGLTQGQYGIVTGAFFLMYSVGSLVMGKLTDRVGSRLALGGALFLWSLACFCHTLAYSLIGLVAARGLLGFFEAAGNPATMKAIAEWFPESERGMAVGLVNAGVSFGVMIAPPGISLLIMAFSWHAAFIVPAIPGFVLAVIWWSFYRIPEEQRWVREPERRLILSARAPLASGAHPVPLLKLLAIRETWGLILARFVGDGAQYFFQIWFPFYLMTVRGFNLKEIALYAWMPFLFADIGHVASGWLSRSLSRRGWSVNRSRKTFIWTGSILVSLSTLFAAFANSGKEAVACICVAMLFAGVRTTGLFTLPADLYRPSEMGSIWGLFAAGGFLGTAALQPIIGTLAEHSYTPIFFIISALPILSSLAISFLVREVRLLPAVSPAPDG